MTRRNIFLSDDDTAWWPNYLVEQARERADDWTDDPIAKAIYTLTLVTAYQKEADKET